MKKLRKLIRRINRRNDLIRQKHIILSPLAVEKVRFIFIVHLPARFFKGEEKEVCYEWFYIKLIHMFAG
jgi:hypothetical protein